MQASEITRSSGQVPSAYKEMIYHVKFETRYDARREIFDFIEVFDNRRRLHLYLGYLSPVEFEAAATKAV